MVIENEDIYCNNSIDEDIWEIDVPVNQFRMRLDQFLANKIEKKTRSQLQKIIKDGFVTVNGKKEKPSYMVRGGDSLIILLPPPQKYELLPENIPLDIIYEDKYLLIVNKKAGMVVHPAFGNLSGTLVNALVYHYQDLSEINGEFRPGIVHRLDKDTSGLLVVAKNDYTHSQLSLQFSNRTINREYRAFIWGHLKQKQGKIETYLIRNPNDRLRMMISNQGKYAITNYQVIKEYPLVSFIKVKLETGRTHQIRVHLSSIGHPVLGDETYGGRQKQVISLNQKSQKLAIEMLQQMKRQALHAKTIGFIHPDLKKELFFDTDLPDDMKNLESFLNQTELNF